MSRLILKSNDDAGNLINQLQRPGKRGTDMEERQKKMAAALAAVNTYLQQEEALAAAQPQLPVPRPVQAVEGGWVMSGKMEMMSMRRLIQMRVFGRVR